MRLILSRSGLHYVDVLMLTFCSYTTMFLYYNFFLLTYLRLLVSGESVPTAYTGNVCWYKILEIMSYCHDFLVYIVHCCIRNII